MNRGRSGWANAVLSPQWDLNLTSSILYSKCIVPNLVSYSTTREQEKLLRKAPSPILERWWWKLLMGWMWKAELQRAGRQWDDFWFKSRQHFGVIFRFKTLISQVTDADSPPSSESGSDAVTGCSERATVALGPTAIRDKPATPNQSPASSTEHTLALSSEFF